MSGPFDVDPLDDLIDEDTRFAWTDVQAYGPTQLGGLPQRAGLRSRGRPSRRQAELSLADRLLQEFQQESRRASLRPRDSVRQAGRSAQPSEQRVSPSRPANYGGGLHGPPLTRSRARSVVPTSAVQTLEAPSPPEEPQASPALGSRPERHPEPRASPSPSNRRRHRSETPERNPAMKSSSSPSRKRQRASTTADASSKERRTLDEK